MKKNKDSKKISNDWYSENQKRNNIEKYCFYVLVFIAAIMFSFVIYLLCVD